MKYIEYHFEGFKIIMFKEIFTSFENSVSLEEIISKFTCSTTNNLNRSILKWSSATTAYNLILSLIAVIFNASPYFNGLSESVALLFLPLFGKTELFNLLLYTIKFIMILVVFLKFTVTIPLNVKMFQLLVNFNPHVEVLDLLFQQSFVVFIFLIVVLDHTAQSEWG